MLILPYVKVVIGVGSRKLFGLVPWEKKSEEEVCESIFKKRLKHKIEDSYRD